MSHSEGDPYLVARRRIWRQTMTIDTTLLRRELAEHQEVLAFWLRQRELNPGTSYFYTLEKVEKQIAALQAQLDALEAGQ